MHPEIIALLEDLAQKIFEHHPDVQNFHASWGNNYGNITITNPQTESLSLAKPIVKPEPPQ